MIFLDFRHHILQNTKIHQSYVERRGDGYAEMVSLGRETYRDIPSNLFHTDVGEYILQKLFSRIVRFERIMTS